MPTLFRIMACRPLDAKQLSEPVLSWTLLNIFQWSSIRNSNGLFHENALESVVCKTVAILSRSQCLIQNISICLMVADASSNQINSMCLSDAIRRQVTESTLAQVMACCLTAPRHYMNQCWFIISKVIWHSPDGIMMRRSEDTNQ